MISISKICFGKFSFTTLRINFAKWQKFITIVYVLFVSIFFLFCRSNSKISDSPLFESTQNANFIYYLGGTFKEEISIFDSQKISIQRNKKDLTNLLNQAFHKKEKYICESLPQGFHRYDFKIFLSKKNNWKGRESYYLKDDGFLNSSKSFLLYMNAQDHIILAPTISKVSKLDLLNSILHFYLFPLFPFGFYPYYERNLEMKFITIQNDEEARFFAECCSQNGKSSKCEVQIQKMITSYGDSYGNTTGSN